MDLILVVVITSVICAKKYYTNNESVADLSVMNEDGSITFSRNDLPIGDNLELRHEPEAFTLILKELELI